MISQMIRKKMVRKARLRKKSRTIRKSQRSQSNLEINLRIMVRHLKSKKSQLKRSQSHQLRSLKSRVKSTD